MGPGFAVDDIYNYIWVVIGYPKKQLWMQLSEVVRMG